MVGTGVPLPRGEAAEEGEARRGARLVGYAPGVFDMFHVGHLNILARARLGCDHLIAGVVSDEIALLQKGQLPVVPETERLAIVGAMKCVDEVFLECNSDKVISWGSLRFDVIFKGDDWQGTDKGDHLERSFAEVGVQVVYLPYTQETSTTRLRSLLAQRSTELAS